MECPCCGGAIGNPLAGGGIRVTCDGAPDEGPFIACTTCTIYEDFTPTDPAKRAWVEAERARLAPNDHHPAPTAAWKYGARTGEGAHRVDGEGPLAGGYPTWLAACGDWLDKRWATDAPPPGDAGVWCSKCLMAPPATAKEPAP